jgi:hypothetical protein
LYRGRNQSWAVLESYEEFLVPVLKKEIRAVPFQVWFFQRTKSWFPVPTLFFKKHKIPTLILAPVLKIELGSGLVSVTWTKACG